MMDHAEGKKILLECDDLLRSLEVPYLLMYGTALGAYRDRGFCPHELDIDLGFTAEDFVPRAGDIAGSLVDAGYEIHSLVEPFTRCWAIKARKNGVGVDLMSFIRWTDQAWGDDLRFCPSTLGDFCGCYPPGMVVPGQSYMSMFGRHFSIPFGIKQYLTMEYGEDYETVKQEHAYTNPGTRTRVDGFMTSRGVPRNLLECLITSTSQNSVAGGDRR